MGKTRVSGSPFYKTAYEGYEAPDAFGSPERLEEYRRHLIRRSQPELNWIVKYLKLSSRRPLRFLEFCSGNGRLGMALAKRRLLEKGLGLEISSSRVQFGERWRADWEITSWINRCADVLTVDQIPHRFFHLAACLTGAFQYFHPISPSAPRQLLNRIRQALKPKGRILLELYPLTQERKRQFALHQGRLQTWEELPPEDQFRFYLNDLTYDPVQNILNHLKIFIGRDGSVDQGRVHRVTYYTKPQMEKLLREAGFAGVRVYGDFQGSGYREGKSAQMVVTAVRV